MKSGKWYFIYSIILSVAVGSFVGSGCRKASYFDNNNVVRTPYGLYFSDKLGAMYNTNDAKAYKIVFPTDGYTARAIITSGNNILWVKKNLHLSADNGLNFNPTNFSVSPQAQWQSLFIDVPSMDRVYLASTKTNGMEFSQDHGVTWEAELATSFALGVTPPTAIQSYTQLKNGCLAALDNTTGNVFIRSGVTAPWNQATVATALPAGNLYLSHINNVLLAADYTGTSGVFYSKDSGANWAQYAGLPTTQQVLSLNAPFDQVVLAGTDSSGIYRFDGTAFVPSNNGLAPFTSVYGIIGKQDTYKNDVIKQYVYIATSRGLFRSEDLGQNWTLVRAGDIRVLY